MAANDDALRLLFDEVDVNKDGLVSGMEWLKGFSGKRADALKPLLQPFRDPETWRELNLQKEQEYSFDQFKQAMASAAPKAENPLGGEFEQAACASPTNTQGSPAEGFANADADAQVKLECYTAPDPLNPGSSFVVLEAVAPERDSRVPVDVICVVDVSGSMGTEAKSGEESHGLSLLDIVKHAVRVVIGLLGDGDRLALVTYSNSATTVFELTSMNEAGKDGAKTALDTMNPYGGTNIWDGVKTAMDIVRNNPREGRMASVMLLTDGTPNRNPDAGIMPTMEEYLTMPANQGMIAAINTFGFGYNLDSALLQQMAALGKGMYSFIPDSGFVGTAFIHSVANCLVSLGGPAEARLSTLGDAQSFGFLKYGFTRSVVMKAAAGADLGQAQLNLKMADGTPSCCTIPLVASQDQEKALKQARRMHFCNTLDVLLAEHAQQHNPEAALAVIEKLRIDLVAMGADETLIPHPVMPGDTVAKDPILADLNGQVREAFSRSDWFNKWGKHYLLSLLMAHRREECSNFKDIGLQSYALDQDVFDDLRDEGDAFFNDLPPPVPSRPASRGTAASAPRAPVNMAAYNNCAGPCFAGECLVAMGGGQPDLRVDTIKQGDLVQSADRT